MSWTVHLIAVAALVVLCVGWYFFQRWIAGKDPELPGVDRRCADCVCNGEGEGRGECHKRGDHSDTGPR